MSAHETLAQASQWGRRADASGSVGPTRAVARFDVARIRADFPGLQQAMHGRPLAYLDNAATTQRCRAAIEASTHADTLLAANVHRGVHQISGRATQAFESVRAKVQSFVGAPRADEIIFTRGTTEAINLVAQTFGPMRVRRGDEVLVTQLEHHANIVPWQLLCARQGAKLVAAPLNAQGAVDVEAFCACLSPRTRLVAISHVSNALGTVLPVRSLARLCRERGIPVLVDGAQAAAHVPIDVQDLGCDFYALSAHKMYGPSGVGALWGRNVHLRDMPPWQGGGGMIETVSFAGSTFAPPPYRFEAGTPDIGGVIALGATLDYLADLDWAGVHAHEAALLAYGAAALAEVVGLRPIGTAAHKTSVLSFVLAQAHPHDIGTIADRHGVAIRSGNHCAQPTMAHFGVAATARASLAMYNTTEDIDALVRACHACARLFGGGPRI